MTSKIPKTYCNYYRIAIIFQILLYYIGYGDREVIARFSLTGVWAASKLNAAKVSYVAFTGDLHYSIVDQLSIRHDVETWPGVIIAWMIYALIFK